MEDPIRELDTYLDTETNLDMNTSRAKSHTFHVGNNQTGRYLSLSHHTKPHKYIDQTSAEMRRRVAKPPADIQAECSPTSSQLEIKAPKVPTGRRVISPRLKGLVGMSLRN